MRQAPWARLYEFVRHTDDVVVPDIATDEQANEIRGRGGYIISLQRAGEVVACSSVPADFVLVHDGRRKSWRKRVDRIMRTIQAMDLNAA